MTGNSQNPALWMPDAEMHPVWWDDLQALPALPATVPQKTDVVVIGCGYTGLNAGIEIARGGRQTLILEAQDIGHGCSSRNGGQIGTSVKPSIATLTRKFGADRAARIRGEGRTALDWIEDRIRTEAIDCDFKRAGRFHAAHSPAQFAALVKDAASLRAEGIPVEEVPRSDQEAEIGSAAYYGGIVLPRHASLHPAKYHQGLVRVAHAAGVVIRDHCPAQRIVRDGDSYRIRTSLGEVRCRDVVIATNGYTTGVTPWLQRRTIPIGSYMIATEPLPRDLIDRIMPTDRVISDSRKVVYYYRPSPDRRRMIFGGRVSSNETNPMISGPRLHADMCRLFPELSNSRISHSWCGTVAYTFDETMHVGRHDGMYYAMGYCGSGVGMASYLGMRLGLQVLGRSEGRTAFDDLPFPTRPFYRGRPWFLPAMVAYYRWRDGRG